ncbi:MAG: glycosyltransferase family 2 protein, partial [Acetobacteraceae bacterium]|nr:glycosyltransferase family 2 protein [Acetobacteraceae bacterium]
MTREAMAATEPQQTAKTVSIAVVVPAWRQPGLLPEAVASVLAQRGAPPTAVVIVDDGCPFPETRRTAGAFAAAHPGRVFALRRPNGGLSAARNTGIDFALAAFPALRAIYFLDADNRLHPPFLARAFAALEAAPPGTGWVHPDFDSFGAAQPDSSAPWSLLAELTENLVEAGSLVRRALFAPPHALRFDEGLRSGFEDWDFWLRAGAAGFRGLHLPDAGFRYRRRPESMVAEAERQREALHAALRRKPAVAPLFTPRRLLALEAEEAPRFALFGADPGEAVRLLLDPGADAVTEALAPDVARLRLLAAEERPVTAPFFPPALLFADPAAMAALGTARLLRSVLWQADALRNAAGADAAVAIELAAPPVEAPEEAGV